LSLVFCNHYFACDRALSMARLLFPITVLTCVPLGLAFRHHTDIGENNAVSSDSQSESSVQATSALAVQMMDAAAECLNVEVSEREKAQLQQQPLVAALAAKGVQLEQQLRWFALSKGADGAIAWDDLDTAHAAEVEAATNSLLELHQFKPDRGFNLMPDNRGDNLVQGPSMSRKDTKMRKARKTSRIMSSGVVEEESAESLETLQDVLAETGIEADDVPPEVLSDLEKDYSWFNQMGEGLHDLWKADSSKPLSRMDKAGYRQWKKMQAHKTGKWNQQISSAYDKLRHPNETVLSIKKLSEAVTQSKADLADLQLKIQAVSSIDWLQFEYKTLGQRFRAKLKGATAAVGRAIFKAFRYMLSMFDGRCKEQNDQIEAQAVKKARLPTPTDLAKKLDDQGNASAPDDGVQNDLNNLESALGSIEDQGSQAETEVEQLFTEMTTVQQSAHDGGLTPELAKRAGKAVDELGTKACESTLAAVARRLKQFVRQIIGELKSMGKAVVKGVKSVRNWNLPNLGTRGIGSFVAAANGGVEEVIDFRNREIGYFTWGAMAVGSSAFGAGIGGYAGFAWKGYKEDWNLQEAYQTATYTTVGITLPLPMSPGLGITFASDSDNSVYPQPFDGVWTLDPAGADGFAVGLGLSASVANLGVVGVDVGQSLYTMMSSECFDDAASFRRAIWHLTCSTCTARAERVAMGLSRTAVHAASFPILTDIIFLFLAKANENRYADLEDSQRSCSARSTRNRDNINALGEHVAQSLDETVALTKHLMETVQTLSDQLDEAIASNPDILLVRKFRKSIEELDGRFCLKSPVVADDASTSHLVDGRASAVRPFGQCTNNADCKLVPNMKCVNQTCQCGADACYAPLRPVVGQLNVTVSQCKNLPEMDSGKLGDHTDAFWELRLEDGSIQRTPVVYNDLNPVWGDAQYIFEVREGDEWFDMAIKDKDLLSEGYVGTAAYKFSKLQPGRSENITMKIVDGACRPTKGTLMPCLLSATVTYVPLPADELVPVRGGQCSDSSNKRGKMRAAVRNMNIYVKGWVRAKQLEIGKYGSLLSAASQNEMVLSQIVDALKVRGESHESR